MPRKFCDGIERRDFLRIGGFSTFGLSFGLPELLALENDSAAADKDSPSDISVIYLFLVGGLSTIDTFDLKPDAPSEIRGEFKGIDTNVPGIQYCEHLPQTAKHADKIALLRSFIHKDNGHGSADKFMMAGSRERPPFGAVLSEELGDQGDVPPYVVFPRMHPFAGPLFLSPRTAPFLIDSDPSDPAFSVPDLAPPLDVDTSRLSNRWRLLRQVDQLHKQVDARSQAGTFGNFRNRAYSLMTSPKTKAAFDLQAESKETRAAYGSHTMGQSCLLARRLVQSGVRYAMITHNNWDTHEANFRDLKASLLPQLDQGLAALLGDLSNRGMLEKTLVIVSGEFGRTPKVNNNAGRDHWGNVFTVAMAGGGVKGGTMVGTSDKWAAMPDKDPIWPVDFGNTIYHMLGINPQKLLYTVENRPIHLLEKGRIIREILA